MVFPYMAHDLAGLLENKKIVSLDQSLLKLYARQLLLGTSYLHRVSLPKVTCQDISQQSFYVIEQNSTSRYESC